MRDLAQGSVTRHLLGKAAFIAVGCSGMFQALGDTRPAFHTSASRILTFAIPTVITSQLPDFQLRHVWYVSVAAVLGQMAFSLWLLRGQLRRRLAPLETPAPKAAAIQPACGTLRSPEPFKPAGR